MPDLGFDLDREERDDNRVMREEDEDMDEDDGNDRE